MPPLTVAAVAVSGDGLLADQVLQYLVRHPAPVDGQDGPLLGSCEPLHAGCELE